MAYEKIAKPAFNDSLSFLKTIDWLITIAHTCSTDETMFKDWFRVLSQLHLEVAPRFTKEEKAELQKLKNETKQSQTDYEKLWGYQFRINELIHTHQLRMVDEEGGVFDSEEW